MFAALLELVVGALLIYLGVTQVCLPLWRNTPLLPMFRRERKLEHELANAEEKVIEASLENKIAETTQRAESIRRAVRRPAKPTSGLGENIKK